MFRIFVGLATLFLLAAAYFLADLFIGAPDVAEIVVLPIYIGFAGIAALVCAIGAFVVWLIRRR